MKRCIAVRTLVIDDDESVCRRLVGWLNDASYEVSWHIRTEEALAEAVRRPPTLALVDLRLPDADGLEVVSRVASGGPTVRVIGMSAFPDEGLVRSAFAAGARDVLCKPIQQSDLLHALERQLIDLGLCYRTETEFNQRLGARLRGLRVGLRRSVTEVAKSSGISTAQLSQIERGRNAASTWTLARISHTLNVPLADIFRDP